MLLLVNHQSKEMKKLENLKEKVDQMVQSQKRVPKRACLWVIFQGTFHRLI